jgi:hypothetical protein
LIVAADVVRFADLSLNQNVENSAAVIIQIQPIGQRMINGSQS